MKKKIIFLCVCLKWFKLTKKNIKTVNLKLLTKEDTFG